MGTRKPLSIVTGKVRKEGVCLMLMLMKIINTIIGNCLKEGRKEWGFTRAALTTHELEWLEPWSKLAELELEC